MAIHIRIHHRVWIRYSGYLKTKQTKLRNRIGWSLPDSLFSLSLPDFWLLVPLGHDVSQRGAVDVSLVFDGTASTFTGRLLLQTLLVLASRRRKRRSLNRNRFNMEKENELPEESRDMRYFKWSFTHGWIFSQSNSEIIVQFTIFIQVFFERGNYPKINFEPSMLSEMVTKLVHNWT